MSCRVGSSGLRQVPGRQFRTWQLQNFRILFRTSEFRIRRCRAGRWLGISASVPVWRVAEDEETVCSCLADRRSVSRSLPCRRRRYLLVLVSLLLPPLLSMAAPADPAGQGKAIPKRTPFSFFTPLQLHCHSFFFFPCKEICTGIATGPRISTAARSECTPPLRPSVRFH